MTMTATENSSFQPQLQRLIIIGAGPAGLTAGIYAGRAHLQPLILTAGKIGGQLLDMTTVENYPGVQSISGTQLAFNLKDHAQEWGSQLVDATVTAIDLSASPFKIWTQSALADRQNPDSRLSAQQIVSLRPENYLPIAEQIKTEFPPTYLAESLIIATGAHRTLLGLPHEERLIGRGISFCATCDAPFFRGKDIAVVGGGNAAIEEAIALAKQAQTVHLIHFEPTFSRSDKSLQEHLLSLPNVVFHWETKITAVHGDKKLEQLTLSSVSSDSSLSKETKLPVAGLFIAIGTVPNSVVFTNQLEIDQPSQGIQIAASSTQTSVPGVFVAGDVTAGIFKQITIAAASGAAAALAADNYLTNHQNS